MAAPSWIFAALGVVSLARAKFVPVGEGFADLALVASALLFMGIAGIFAGVSLLADWLRRGTDGMPSMVRLTIGVLISATAVLVGAFLAYVAAGSRNIPLVLFGLFIAGWGLAGVVFGARIFAARGKVA